MWFLLVGFLMISHYLVIQSRGVFLGISANFAAGAADDDDDDDPNETRALKLFPDSTAQ